ncbi:MAG TPA: DUF6644 family protein [Burkholderiales bacterium]|nr:DUF6644 family protein [Burkholderiales bacterium]
MEAIVLAIGNWPGAELLRESWAAYIFVNAAHILGIGLLLGSILPLDLRLLGLFRSAPLPVIGPFLLWTARSGFLLALLMGLWLFSVKPDEYVENAAFQCKVALLVLALMNVVFQHRGASFRMALQGGKVHPRVRVLALISACLWLSVLVAGRWIGFL